MTFEQAKIALILKSAQSWKRAVFSTVIGLALGIGGFQVTLIMLDKPPTFNNVPPILVQDGNYLGIQVDRTRLTYCQLHPTHVLFTTSTLSDGVTKVIYPLSSPNFLWPHLGREKLLVLFDMPHDLPAGKWYLQSVGYDDCHWYSGIFGYPLIVSKPLLITMKGPPQ